MEEGNWGGGVAACSLREKEWWREEGESGSGESGSEWYRRAVLSVSVKLTSSCHMVYSRSRFEDELVLLCLLEDDDLL